MVPEIDPEVGEDNIRIDDAEPLLVVLAEGAVAIFDQVQFVQKYDCLAAKWDGGVLSVLNSAGRWVDIGTVPKPQAVA